MTDKLPPNLLALFAPRPALRYYPPMDHAPEDRKTANITGIASFVPALQQKAEVAKSSEEGELSKSDSDYEAPPTESYLEKRDREKQQKAEHQKWLVSEGFKEQYAPASGGKVVDESVRGDAFKTLFVGRLPYEADVKDLEREFGRFGAIERVRIVTDRGPDVKDEDGKVKKKSKKGKSRGYAFVVFEKESAMKGTTTPPTPQSSLLHKTSTTNFV